MAVFAVIAKISVTSLGRMIKSFCSGEKTDLGEKLRQIIHYPIWATFLLFGVVVTFRWLNLFASYQFAILGILRTIILLVVALTLTEVHAPEKSIVEYQGVSGQTSLILTLQI